MKKRDSQFATKSLSHAVHGIGDTYQEVGSGTLYGFRLLGEICPRVIPLFVTNKPLYSSEVHPNDNGLRDFPATQSPIYPLVDKAVVLHSGLVAHPSQNADSLHELHLLPPTIAALRKGNGSHPVSRSRKNRVGDSREDGRQSRLT